MTEDKQLTDRINKNDPVLETRQLVKTFDGVVALDGIELEIRENEIVGVIGPNGAGKSTLFNCIMSVLPVTSGTILFNGKNITNWRTSTIVQEGISRTFQLSRVFPGLTVKENLKVSQDHRKEYFFSTAFRSTDDGTKAHMNELISLVGLSELQDESAANLSTGQKKLLAIACALVSRPEVVLLDEPTAGVTPSLIEDIVEAILNLNDLGTTFFIVEHNMDVVRKISEYLYVMANGRNLVHGQPEEVLDDSRVLEVYFGE